MQDMRYLYGMPKTASARRDEFVGNLRNYFGSLRLDGRPVKTASEKREVVAGLLSKYAADCGLRVNYTNQKRNGGSSCKVSAREVKEESLSNKTNKNK